MNQNKYFSQRETINLSKGLFQNIKSVSQSSTELVMSLATYMYVYTCNHIFFFIPIECRFQLPKGKRKAGADNWGGGLKKNSDFSGNCVGDNKDKMTLKAHYCMGIFKFYIQHRISFTV